MVLRPELWTFQTFLVRNLEYWRGVWIMDYEIIRYRPELKTQVIELQTHLWSPSLSLNQSYFEWKYEKNPYCREPLIYLAMRDGKAVGMRGFFGVHWEWGDPATRFTSLYADDMVIAPDHRHRGLMSKIMTAAFQDLAANGHGYVFNLSAGLTTLHSSLSMGWRSAGWVRPMRRRRLATVLRRGGLRRMQKLAPLSKTLARISSNGLTNLCHPMEDADLERIRSRLKQYPEISVEDAPRCKAMAELVNRIGPSGRIRHVRDTEYFQWRFQNPLSRYRYVFLGEDRLEAFVVLQEYEIGLKWWELNIVNWEGSSAQALERVLKVALTTCAKGRDLVIWSATLPEPKIALLKNNGFRVTKPEANINNFSPPAILVRPISNFQSNQNWTLGDRRLLDLAAWDIQMLYSMHG